MENHLLTAPIPKLVRGIALPASIGFFFNTMYNVVDTYYGGLISTQAVAALSLSFPVFFLIIALGSGISTGAAALIANALGADRKDEARRYASQAMLFSISVAIVLTVAGRLAAPWLFGLLGATGEYLELALSYIDIIFLGTVFFLLTFVLNSTLTAQGDTRTFRNLLIIGFFLNLVFDPWFIYGGWGLPALGLGGVAWATVVIQVISTLYLFYKSGRTGFLCRRCLRLLKPERKYLQEIARQGLPASLNMMTVAVGVFVITYFVSRFGQAAVAAYGIATRIDQMAVLPVIGLNIAVLTLVGQNNGARLFGRCRLAIAVARRYGLGVTAVSGTLVFLFAGRIAGLFTQSDEVVSIAAGYLRVSVFVYWAYTLLYLYTSALQGLKKPIFAVWIGLYRQLLTPLIVFPLLAGSLALGLMGIWWGIALVNWSAVAITLFYFRKTAARIFKATGPSG